MSTTGYIGSPTGNVIVPIQNFSKSTYQLSLVKTTDITVAVEAGSALNSGYTVSCLARFYSDGAASPQWKVSLNCQVTDTGSGTSRTGIVVTFAKSSIKFAASQTYVGCGAVLQGTGAPVTDVQADSNANAIELVHSSGTAYNWSFSGDFLLAQEPTDYTVAANMQNVPNVVAYFPQVSTSGQGLFPSLITSLDNATATQLGLKTYLHGTTYNGGNAPTVTGMTITRALFMPRQMQDGTWWVKVAIAGSQTANSSVTLSINGLLFKNLASYYQAVSVWWGTNQGMRANVFPNTNQIEADLASGTGTFVSLIGDLELDSKPTWAY